MKEQYKLVSGDKENFESEINRLYKEGYTPISGLCMVCTEDKSVIFSMLMQYVETEKS